jgi:myo-inositol 2-dehydrogenase / D-chiro-inositol 1-dehydrogenase
MNKLCNASHARNLPNLPYCSNANGIYWTFATGKEKFFKIEGSEGWIHATYTGLKAGPESILTSKIGPKDIRFYVKTDKRDFIDCVKTRQQTLEPVEVGHRVTSMGLLGHIAIQLGQKLQWDPEKERFVGNNAANAMLDKPIHTPKA